MTTDMNDAESCIAAISKPVGKWSNSRAISNGKILKAPVSVQADRAGADASHGKGDLGELLFIVFKWLNHFKNNFRSLFW
jgi:hypothetical protein